MDRAQNALIMDLRDDVVKLSPDLSKLKILRVHPLMEKGHGILNLLGSWIGERKSLVYSS